MLKYILKRILHLIPVIIMISIILFGVMKIMPVDPVLLLMPEDPSLLQDKTQYERVYKEIERKYGYDKSIPVQYMKWLQRTITGDLGESTRFHKPVIDVVKEPLRNTLYLNIGSTTIGLFVSILIGITSAVKKGTFYDKFWQTVSLIGISLPTFFIGLMLIYTFALKLKWLPANGMPVLLPGQNDYVLQWVRTLILPTITLTIGSVASISRYVRSAMIDALSQDYIRTARSKGVKEKVVIYRHAFRNALIPVVTIVAWAIVGMFSGAAITETVFAYNGIGRVMIESVFGLDYNVVLALNMFFAILSVLGNLLMDLGYALVDPRIRLE